MTPFARAFTLIELLVVVAVLAVLAALAVPNFLEAQTRAKVSAARAGQRTLAGALAAYRVDFNAYPPTRTVLPEDPLALLATEQLRPLTTPIAYVAPSAFRDPFGGPRLYSDLQGVAIANPGLVAPGEMLANPSRSLLYFAYGSTAERFGFPGLRRFPPSIVSIGPDQEDSLGAFHRLAPTEFNAAFGYARHSHPVNTLYDPTNGSVSSGDLVRFTEQ